MGRVCVGRLCYGPSLQWAEFAMGRDVQLPCTSMSNPNTTESTPMGVDNKLNLKEFLQEQR